MGYSGVALLVTTGRTLFSASSEEEMIQTQWLQRQVQRFDIDNLLIQLELNSYKSKVWQGTSSSQNKLEAECTSQNMYMQGRTASRSIVAHAGHPGQPHILTYNEPRFYDIHLLCCGRYC